MNRIMLVLFVVLISNVLIAQYVPTAEDLDHFANTKTLVVLESNPMLGYNLVIKDIIQREWTLTEYDFISYKEFDEKYRFDPQYSFVVMTQVSFDKDKTGARYKFLQVLLGGEANEVRDMKEISSVPLSYRNVEEESYIYKLATLVRFLQNHIKLITEKPEIISANMFKYYNDNIRSIHNKTLYLIPEELDKDVNTIAEIKKVYPYKFQLSTKDEIAELVKQRDPNVVFLHKVGPEGTHLSARCYKFIVGAADANLFYFDVHMIDKKMADGFLKSDFKNLAK